MGCAHAPVIVLTKVSMDKLVECIVLAIQKQARKPRPRFPFAIDSAWMVFRGLQVEVSVKK